MSQWSNLLERDSWELPRQAWMSALEGTTLVTASFKLGDDRVIVSVDWHGRIVQANLNYSEAIWFAGIGQTNDPYNERMWSLGQVLSVIDPAVLTVGTDGRWYPVPSDVAV